jgi:hypothetical protein
MYAIWKQSQQSVGTYVADKQQWPCPTIQGHKGHMKVLENVCVQYESNENPSWTVIVLINQRPCPRFQGHKGHMKVAAELS